MFLLEGMDVNSQNHLTLGGCDAVDLAHQYGTPLYVMDELVIRDACKRYHQSIHQFYGGHGRVLFASKAFCCKEIYRIMKEEGLGLDVVSAGELMTAKAADFPSDRIFFHGNNKTEAELCLALEHGVGRIVVDNLTELEQLNNAAASVGKKANILFRIKPGIDAHTHSFIRTGQIDSKFGLALENGEAMGAIKAALEMEHIVLMGLHCHIGSQIFDIDPFVLAAEVMLEFIGQINSELNYRIAELNLGGGFGVRYTEADSPVPYESYMQAVSSALRQKANVLGLDMPYVYLEPGRSIVGPAGTTLYTVGNVKEIPGVRTYAAIDGGMTDNPRYALYQSDYHIALANRMNEEADSIVTVAGKCCESGDLIQENVSVPLPRQGDTLAVFTTGAYNFSMASNYNRIPRPPVIMVKNGTSRVIVRRETYDDLIQRDI